MFGPVSTGFRHAVHDTHQPAYNLMATPYSSEPQPRTRWWHQLCPAYPAIGLPEHPAGAGSILSALRLRRQRLGVSLASDLPKMRSLNRQGRAAGRAAGSLARSAPANTAPVERRRDRDRKDGQEASLSFRWRWKRKAGARRLSTDRNHAPTISSPLRLLEPQQPALHSA